MLFRSPRRRRSSVSSSGSSSSGSSDSWTSSRHAHEDQLQWDESIRQLQLIFSVVALPFVAKWAGRKFAYWGTSNPSYVRGPEADLGVLGVAFGRYQDLGLGRRFWLGPLDGLVRRWS